MERINKTEIWSRLNNHATFVSHDSMISNFNSIEASGIILDFTKQQVTEKVFNSLVQLAHNCHLKDKIQQLLNGGNVNQSEMRPALHTALRASHLQEIWVNNKNIMHEVANTREQIGLIAQQVREKKWLGFSGESITDVINIGIGGSDLGARFCLQAFSDFLHPELHFHFISDADPHVFRKTVANLRPQTTLFIISSKSFTTEETLYNARKAKAWIGEDRLQQHFIAVTAEVEKAASFGMKTIVPIWNWVGGRYSLCSGVNLITAIAIGCEAFSQLLAGANSMDLHYQNAEFHQNLPVLLGLLGVWNNNFLNIPHLLMLTYSQYLDAFVPYIQQLEMESNGKSIDNHNQKINYATCPIIWGGPGNQAQHSYYQLLCQGTHKISVDLISINLFDEEMLNQMCFNKIRVLSEGVHHNENLSNCIHGKIPLNHIRIKDYSPFTIGALVALYEHKVYTQSVIWNINPFDQPGVESAKRTRQISSLSALGV